MYESQIKTATTNQAKNRKKLSPLWEKPITVQHEDNWFIWEMQWNIKKGQNVLNILKCQNASLMCESHISAQSEMKEIAFCIKTIKPILRSI